MLKPKNRTNYKTHIMERFVIISMSECTPLLTIILLLSVITKYLIDKGIKNESSKRAN